MQLDTITIYPFLAGQVHRACLNGQEVVLKVQRPGLKELFDIDLKNLRASHFFPEKEDNLPLCID